MQSSLSSSKTTEEYFQMFAKSFDPKLLLCQNNRNSFGRPPKRNQVAHFQKCNKGLLKFIRMIDFSHPGVIRAFRAPKFVILAPSYPLVFLLFSSLVSPSCPLPAAGSRLPPSCPKLKHLPNLRPGVAKAETFINSKRPVVAKAQTFIKSKSPGVAKAETFAKIERPGW